MHYWNILSLGIVCICDRILVPNGNTLSKKLKVQQKVEILIQASRNIYSYSSWIVSVS